nr:DNA/RNA helicase domain-containing protein [Thioalkalivibrio sp.]
MSESSARYGWQSDLPAFVRASPAAIEAALLQFLQGASSQQITSWHDCIRWLQREYDRCVREDSAAETYYTLLEYELPRDFRRPDIIVLEGGTVVVLEVKGHAGAGQAARDQVAGYARDLAAYHSACADRSVLPVVVPSDGPALVQEKDGVSIIGPHGVAQFLLDHAAVHKGLPIRPDDFLNEDAYAPLPTIVQAARSIYEQRPLPFIKRARANTDPALEAITDIAHQAARTKTRHLVLLSGIPGSGKTLVGLQLVHAGWLDDLAIERGGRKRSPAVYLSGNGPLVAVLQDALKGGAVPGSVFVQDIKKYVAYYAQGRGRTPPEHLVVFDEAQRAHDADRVAEVHRQPLGSSEPEHLLEFCSRIPEWCVLVALIGDGQAIHVGEEVGVELWREAIAGRPASEQWSVHVAPQVAPLFKTCPVPTHWHDVLNLDTEIRFHLTPKVHAFVEALLEGTDPAAAREIADELYQGNHRFLVTRSLEDAKAYLRERYADAREARFGLLASSKDKLLINFGVDNSFQTTKRLRAGPWYNRPPEDPLSCCQLDMVATEFSSQGLELDAALLAWGSDLIHENGAWSIRMSRGTRGKLRDPKQLRKNVYRVLLTRGRDGTVVYVPPSPQLDETSRYLVACGMRPLTD